MKSAAYGLASWLNMWWSIPVWTTTRCRMKREWLGGWASARAGCWMEIKMVCGDRILKARARVVRSQDLPATAWRVPARFTEISDEDSAIVAEEVKERTSAWAEGT